jgi:hypothetical protein
MSGDGYIRKYKSGSEKRKQKKVKEEHTQVLSGSLLKYLNTRQIYVDDLNIKTQGKEIETDQCDNEVVEMTSDEYCR